LRPDRGIHLFTKGVGVTYLEPVKFFSAGPDRPVELLNLTGEKQRKTGRLVTEVNWRKTGPFDISIN
jgi:hypothetical protein